MKTFVFGVKKPHSSNSLSLIICEETKEYEKGQCCYNSDYHIDVYVKQKELDDIEKYLIDTGFTRTDIGFGTTKK